MQIYFWIFGIFWDFRTKKNVWKSSLSIFPLFLLSAFPDSMQQKIFAAEFINIFSINLIPNPKFTCRKFTFYTNFNKFTIYSVFLAGHRLLGRIDLVGMKLLIMRYSNRYFSLLCYQIMITFNGILSFDAIILFSMLKFSYS